MAAGSEIAGGGADDLAGNDLAPFMVEVEVVESVEEPPRTADFSVDGGAVVGVSFERAGVEELSVVVEAAAF